jgi:hypothetical protein
MCKKIKLIGKIINNDATFEEIVAYLKRLTLVHVVLVILVIIDLVSAPRDHTVTTALKIVSIFFYAVDVPTILLVALYPTINNSIVPIISICMLIGWNIIQIVVNLALFGDLSVLIVLISVVIQLGTLFILHELRRQIHEKHHATGFDIENPPAPVAVASYVSVAPKTVR